MAMHRAVEGKGVKPHPQMGGAKHTGSVSEGGAVSPGA